MTHNDNILSFQERLILLGRHLGLDINDYRFMINRATKNEFSAINNWFLGTRSPQKSSEKAIDAIDNHTEAYAKSNHKNYTSNLKLTASLKDFLKDLDVSDALIKESISSETYPFIKAFLNEQRNLRPFIPEKLLMDSDKLQKSSTKFLNLKDFYIWRIRGKNGSKFKLMQDKLHIFWKGTLKARYIDHTNTVYEGILVYSEGKVTAQLYDLESTPHDMKIVNITIFSNPLNQKNNEFLCSIERIRNDDKSIHYRAACSPMNQQDWAKSPKNFTREGIKYFDVIRNDIPITNEADSAFTIGLDAQRGRYDRGVERLKYIDENNKTEKDFKDLELDEICKKIDREILLNSIIPVKKCKCPYCENILGITSDKSIIEI